MAKLMDLWDKYKLQLIIAIGLVAGVLYYLAAGHQPAPTNTGIQAVAASSSSSSSEQRSPRVVAVDVKGAVKRPGMYQLKSDSRVNEAVNAAGGALPSADLRQVNLAKQLTDQQMIYVPTQGEQVTAENSLSTSATSSASGDNNINLNTATKEQLCQIPGIGEKKAELILQYRQEHGQFKTIDELKEINGFGEKTVTKLKEHLSV